MEPKLGMVCVRCCTIVRKLYGTAAGLGTGGGGRDGMGREGDTEM